MPQPSRKERPDLDCYNETSPGLEALEPRTFFSSSLIWDPLDEPGSGGRFDSIAVSPHDGSDLLIGGDLLGVGFSSNGGDSWSVDQDSLLSWEIGKFAWHPTNGDIVWAGSLSGPIKSEDGGLTWFPARGGVDGLGDDALYRIPRPATGSFYSAPIEEVVYRPGNPDTLLAFGGDFRRLRDSTPVHLRKYGSVWKSTDGGSTWNYADSIASDGDRDLASFGENIQDAGYVTNERVLAVTYGGGVWASANHGDSWTQQTNGLSANARVTALAVDADLNGTAWLTVEDQGVFKTTNGGDSWFQVGNGSGQGLDVPNNTWSSIAVADDDTLYVGNLDTSSSSRGVYRSDNGGTTWTRILSSPSQVDGGIGPAYPAGIQPNVVAVNPNNSDEVYAGNSAYVLKTSNAGGSWTDLTATQVDAAQGLWTGQGFSGLVAINVEWNPYDADHVVIQGKDAARLMQSWDGGVSWRIDNNLDSPWRDGFDVAFAPGNRIVAGLGPFSSSSTDTLIRSTDAGVNWEPVNLPPGKAGLDVTAVHIDTDSTNRVWAVVDRELWYSANAFTTDPNAVSWTNITLPGNPEVGDLVADPRDGDTFYLASSVGLFRTTNGQNFIDIGPGIAALDSAKDVQLNIDSSHPDLVYATRNKAPSAQGGVLRYDAGSGSWQQLWTADGTVGRYISDLAVDPTDSDRIVVATTDVPIRDVPRATGIWMTEDGGATWTSQNTGLDMTDIRTLEFSPDGSRVIAGTGGRGFQVAELATNSPEDGLIGGETNRWTFDSNANDSVGSVNGTPTNGPSIGDPDSVLGIGSLRLDGGNDYIDLNHPDLKDSFSRYTVSAWFEAQDTNFTQMIYEEGGSTNGLALRLKGSTLEAAVRNNSAQATVSIANVTPGQWHLAVVTFDQGQLTLYLDGSDQIQTTSAGYSTVGNHGNSANIGRQNSSAFGTSGSSYFDGQIDDVRIFDGVAISAGQVGQLYGTSNDLNLIIEAESASGIASDWSVEDNSYVVWNGSNQINNPVSPANDLSYTINVPVDGLYTIQLEVRSPRAGGDDSVWVKLDGANLGLSSGVTRADGWVKFNVIDGGSTTFNWDRVHNSDAGNVLVEFYLTEGEH